MTTQKAQAVFQRVLARAQTDSTFRAALSASPAHAIRRATWLSQEERRAATAVDMERLRRVASTAHAARTAGSSYEEGWATTGSAELKQPTRLPLPRALTTISRATSFKALKAKNLVPDNSVTWQQAHDSAILQNPYGDIWNAGCVVDVVVDGRKNVVVATDTGGLWRVTADGQAEPLTDHIDNGSDFSTLVVVRGGPVPGTLIIAGGAGLCQNHPSASPPTDTNPYQHLNTFSDITNTIPIGADGNPVRINKLAVDDASNFLFAATDQGVYYQSLSTLGASSAVWTGPIQASLPSILLSVIDTRNEYFLSVAIGPPDNVGNPSIVASTGFQSSRAWIYFGTWSSGQLSLQAATLLDADGSPYDYILKGIFSSIAVASCPTNRSHMYASAASTEPPNSGNSGKLAAVFSSVDGGKLWILQTDGRATGTVTAEFRRADDTDPKPVSSLSLYDLSADQETRYIRSNNNIAVSYHPTFSNGWPAVAVCSRRGFFLSYDNARSWAWYEDGYNGVGGNSYELPGDEHALLFDPADPADPAAIETLYVCGDQGLVSIAGVDPSRSLLTSTVWPNQVNSKYNRALLNLQFMSPSGNRPPPGDQWSDYGSLGVSRAVPFSFAGGAQDNGVLYGQQVPGVVSSLTQSIGGDGYEALILDATSPEGVIAILLANSNNYQDQLTMAFLESPGFFAGASIIPVPGFNNEQPPNCAGSAADWAATPTVSATQTFFRRPIVELLRRPLRTPSMGTLYAVGVGPLSRYCGYPPGGPGQSSLAFVFGLYVTTESRLIWSLIGYANMLQFGNELEDVWAIASYDGSAVFLGTNFGRVLWMSGSHPGLGWGSPAVQMGVQAFGTDLSSGSRGTNVARIVFDESGNGYAAYNSNGKGTILAGTFPSWSPTGAPDQDRYYGVDTGDDGTIYAIVDKYVIRSQDHGNNWARVSDGLPASPHCADVRCVKYADGSRHVFLSTFGRSVWRADLL